MSDSVRPHRRQLTRLPVPGILQARTLEWVAISFSNAWKWKVKVKSLSHVRLLATPRPIAHQAPLSMGFSRQEYWSGVPFPRWCNFWTSWYIWMEEEDSRETYPGKIKPSWYIWMEEEDSRETYPGKIKPNWDLPTVIPFNKVKKNKQTNKKKTWVSHGLGKYH